MSLLEKWSKKYKKSIDCNNPKGFSQKAHCQGRKKNEMKTFKEYFGGGVMTRGFAIGPIGINKPMASMGSMGQFYPQHRRYATTFNAAYKGHGHGTFKPMLSASSASKKSDELEHMKLMNKAFRTMPGSQKQREIKKQINVIRKRLGLRPMSEDEKRIPRKPGQKAKSDKHSDLYTDEDPKGTIHGLGFTDKAKAKQSVSKIRGSNRTHAHKMQAAIAMSQRAKVASQRAKDPEKKKNLGQAHKVYQNYIDKNKKSKD